MKNNNIKFCTLLVGIFILGLQNNNSIATENDKMKSNINNISVSKSEERIDYSEFIFGLQDINNNSLVVSNVKKSKEIIAIDCNLSDKAEINFSGAIYKNFWNNQYDTSDQNEYMNFIENVDQYEMNIKFLTEEDVVSDEIRSIMNSCSSKNKNQNIKHQKSNNKQFPKRPETIKYQNWLKYNESMNNKIKFYKNVEEEKQVIEKNPIIFHPTAKRIYKSKKSSNFKMKINFGMNKITKQK